MILQATNEFSLNHQKKILSFVENVEDFTNKITKCKSSVLTFTYLDTTPLSLVLDKLPPSEYRTKGKLFEVSLNYGVYKGWMLLEVGWKKEQFLRN